MTRQLNCIIVDDNDIDRLTTVSLVKRHPLLQINGIYQDAESALAAVADNLPDIAFFDVDMPGMSGLELRRKLTEIPACIFITSFPEYAAESFEVAALDFIVKPLRGERFQKTIQRIEEFFTVREKASLYEHTLGGNTIFIKEGHEQVKLSLHEIIYLEALKDYTKVVTTARAHCVLSAMGNLLKEPGFQSFVRIHKSYAVQKHHIERIKSQELWVKGIALPVGRAYKDALADIK